MSTPLSPKLAAGLIENFRSDYDKNYTTDISKQMQMPDRLGAINNVYGALSQPVRPYNDSMVPNLDMPHYMMDSPPRVLTLHDHIFTSSDDEGGDVASEVDDPLESNVYNEDYSSPKKGGHLEENDIDVPVTPGSMLLLQNGDEMAVIRRQVAKLTRHVVRLQEENIRRHHRELIVYPVLVGYCLIQLVRLLFRSK